MDCGSAWPVVSAVYRDLTGLTLPEVMRPVERRTVDAVLVRRDGGSRIPEVDETQHFNAFRAATLAHYPEDLMTAYDRALWRDRSLAKARLEGGGFARPMPPPFPSPNGRHRQRAFRDMLSDLLPPIHGFLPTLRVADFEVRDWLHRQDAADRMTALIRIKIAAS